MHYQDSTEASASRSAPLGDFGYARALLAGSAPRWARARSPTRLEYLHNDGPWDVPDHFRKANARAALRRCRWARARLGATAMAYERQLELDRPGAAARARRRPHRPLRHAGRQRRRRVAARYSVRLDYAAPLAGGELPDHGLLVPVPPQPVLQLHLLPRTTRSTATSSSRPTTATSTAGPANWTKSARPVRRAHAQHGRLRAAPGSHRPGRAVTRRRAARAAVHDAARTTSSRAAPASSLQNDTQWNDWFRSILGLRYDRYRFDVDA